MKSQIIERDRADLMLVRSEDENVHTFVISDESVDSHGTSFSMTGWDLSQYSKNPIVTYGHPDVSSPDPNLIIGRSSVHISDNRLIAKIEYDMGNPLAREVKRKVEDGFINMASIRAYVEDGKYDEERDVIVFTKQRLVDWGIVMHGSNKNAMKKRDLALDLGIIQPEVIKDDKSDPKLIAEARELVANTFLTLNRVKK